MRAALVAFLLSLLVGCGGGEKPAETKGTDKTAAKDGSAASATAKTDGEKQVVTYQTGDQKMTVESDGKTMVIKSADGKETTVNIGAAQKFGEAIATAADKEVAAATDDADEASEASESSDVQAMTIKTGEASMTFGGTNVPKDFPLPLYKGAKVEYSAHIEPTADNKEENYQIHLTSKDPADTVAKFYEAELKRKGLEVNRIDQKFNGMEIITLACESEKDKVSATAQAQRDADSDTTRIILTWTNQK